MSNGKRWCFTINAKEGDQDGQGGHALFQFIEKVFGTAADGPQGEVTKYIEYIVAQREKGAHGGNVHIQGFVIFNQKVRMTWLHKNFWNGGHYELARGTNQQCKEYCTKNETWFMFPPELIRTFGCDGRWERGTLPKRGEAPKRNDMLMDAAEELDIIKEGYKRPHEVNTLSLMQPGFIQAYRMLTEDILGPYRPELKIITMIGRPGTGKSFTIHKIFEDKVGRALYGNNGVWFQNPTAEVMVFEEFCGQIQLQRMLQYLDPYPLALEVKGRMAPAMYKVVVITSNTRPDAWYKGDEAGQPGKRTDSILALWDRLGFSNGAFVPVRTCGYYLEEPCGYSIPQARNWFTQQVAHIVNWVEPISDDEDTQPDAAAGEEEGNTPPSSQEPNATVPEFEQLGTQDTPDDSDSA